MFEMSRPRLGRARMLWTNVIFYAIFTTTISGCHLVPKFQIYSHISPHMYKRTSKKLICMKRMFLYFEFGYHITPRRKIEVRERCTNYTQIPLMYSQMEFGCNLAPGTSHIFLLQYDHTCKVLVQANLTPHLL